MPGVPDPLYVLARAALLDALEALEQQRGAAILVGAQAIYLHTGAIDLAVPEYTTDADVVIDPGRLHSKPEIDQALTSVGFVRGPRVGAWTITKELDGRAVNVELDLMVPDAVGGAGRRAARLVGHKEQVARKARGLEPALIDKELAEIAAFDPADTRSFSIAVAGPAALIVSKVYKIDERLRERRLTRLDDKDALDVLRLLQAVSTSTLAQSFGTLVSDSIARDVTREALISLRSLFGDARSVGSSMAVRAAGPLAAGAAIAQSCAILTTDLLEAVGE
jgi:hypothetical protein